MSGTETWKSEAFAHSLGPSQQTPARSWGTDWGLGGYFYIRRGTDEAGIESTPAAGMPDMWD